MLKELLVLVLSPSSLLAERPKLYAVAICLFSLLGLAEIKSPALSLSMYLAF